MEKIIITFLLLFVSTFIEAQSEDCYASLDFYPVDLYPTNQNLFPHDTPFIFSETSVTIGSDIYTIKDIIPDAFMSKKELVSLIGCIDDFEQFTDLLNGEYYQYILTEDYEPGHDRFILLKISDCGSDYTLLLTMRGMYRLDYKQDYDLEDLSIIIKKPERYSTDYLLTDPDTSSISIEVIREPEYEIFTEQVLLHDAYSEFKIIPAVYDTVFFTVQSETSACPEAQIIEEEFIYEYLATPSIEHIVQESIFELVTELVLLQGAHDGPSFFKRALKDTMLMIEFPYQEINVIGTKDDCYGSYFIDCLDTEVIQHPGRDTLVRNVIDYCPVGYNRLGLYCYVLENSPNIYDRRQYYKLVLPPIININHIEPQDKTLTITKVVNKEDIPVNCLEIEEIEVFSLITISEETAEIEQVPALYGTRSYRRIITPGEIAVDTTLVDQAQSRSFDLYYPETEVFDIQTTSLLSYEPCKEIEIVNELINLGYLEESKPLDRDAYYLAIAQFQKDNDLNIGVIDWPFIELLLF